MKNIIKNEKGAILITMLLLMVIVTLIGVIAINTATVDIQITGNLKRVSTASQGAEAGIDLSIPIIENTLAAGQLTTSSTTISSSFTFPASYTASNTAYTVDLTTIGGTATNLGNEIQSDVDSTEVSTFNADISLSDLNGVAVNVDIDRLYSYALPGGSLEFASGYEGVGAGMGGGGAGVLYSVDSQGSM